MEDQTDEVSDFPVQTNDDQLALSGEEDKSGKHRFEVYNWSRKPINRRSGFSQH